ncbi:NosD domain-containing protein [Candidatus Entotheonella palauensis]|uniref:NosD domain-containing protein n=1 Tax=Candidatus Entotheonella palauensis TaxID=93172 RepID=UPI000B7F7FA6|nr:NosD domain-containing protein [Candidatus Entotheonella palauensis]
MIALGVLGLAGMPQQALASTQVVSADRINCASDIAPDAPVRRRIQPAVREAIARGEDEVILICPGTYFGPVTINDEDAHIDFIGVGDKSDIIVRARSGSGGPIFRVLRAEHIGFFNLTVDGMSRLVPADGLGGVVTGIFFRRTEEATMDGIMVQNIDSRDGNAQGICIHMQGGNGVDQEFEIKDNILSNCTRVGILADGEGVEADVRRNIIVGPLGPHTFAPNGIQVSRGAVAEIYENIIDAVESLTPTIGAGSGVLAFCAEDAHIEDNIITGTDLGVSVADSEEITVLSNDLLGNSFSVLLQTVGFFFGNPNCPGGSHPPADNRIAFNNLLESINVGIDVNTLDMSVGVPEDNEAEGNVMEGQGFFGILVRQGVNNSFDDNMIFDDSSPDIVDQTTGNGTSGTANFYDDNVCTGTSIPEGLCDPIFPLTRLATGGAVDSKSLVAVSPY